MSDSDAFDRTPTNSESLDYHRTGFEVGPDVDDEFFGVVQTEYLHELLAVHSQTDGNAVFLVREGMGLKARGRSYHCYWYDVEIPDHAFELFTIIDADFWVDTAALENALTETQAKEVALRGKDDGQLQLQNRQQTYELRASELPLLEHDTDEENLAPQEPTENLRPSDFNKPGLAGRDPTGYLTLSVDATRFHALADFDDSHDHLGVIIDGGSGTAEWFFFNSDEEKRTVGLTLEPDDFQELPVPFTDELNDDAVVRTPVCRPALDQATAPMRGQVQVWVPDISLIPVSIRYHRSGTTLPVHAQLSKRKGASETFERIIADKYDI